MTTEVNSTQLSALADAVQNAAAENASSAKKRGRKAKVEGSVAPAVKSDVPVVPASDAPKKKASKKKEDASAVKSDVTAVKSDAPVAPASDAPKKKASKKKEDAPAAVSAPVAQEADTKVKKPRAKKNTDAPANAADASANAEKPKRKKRAKKDTTDDGQPKKKRAMGPYMLFAQSIRAQLKQDNPTLKVTELAKLTGQKWGALSAEEKQKFAPLKSENPADAVATPAVVVASQ